MPTVKMLDLVERIEKNTSLKCNDYTFSGVCNFIEKYKNLAFTDDLESERYDLYELFEEPF